MQIKTFPHEFLARWGRDGKLQGYHVITVAIACDDTTGLPIKKDPTNPESENWLESFSQAQTITAAGLTLDEVLSQVQAAALAQVDSLTTELTAAQGRATTAQAQAATLQAQVDALTTELTAAQGQVSMLQAQAVTLQAQGSTPPDPTSTTAAPATSTGSWWQRFLGLKV